MILTDYLNTLYKTIYSFGEICRKDYIALNKWNENYKFAHSISSGTNQKKPG